MEDTEATTRNRITPEVVNVMKHLETREGRLSPPDVVTEAQNPDSLLHEFFEWDDGIAGAKYRLEQARTLIRRVKFEILVDEVTVQSVRYISEPDKDESMYVAQPKIRSKKHASSVMASELTRLLGNANRTVSIAWIHAAILPAGIATNIESVRDSISDILDSCRR